MRVSITGESAVTDEFRAEFPDTTEDAVVQTDLTAQAFGLADAASVVAIAQGAADLASMLVRMWKRLHARDPVVPPQTLHLKTAFGSVTLELSDDATLEDLRRLAEPLFAIA